MLMAGLFETSSGPMPESIGQTTRSRPRPTEPAATIALVNPRILLSSCLTERNRTKLINF